jgi:hypothetical protein
VQTSDISAIWAQTRSAPCDDPVFVLCAGRSGSTLLRFLLDSHPVLACPAETKIPGLCGMLAPAWSLVEDVPVADGSGEGSPATAPPEVLAGLRQSFDPLIAACLARTGKKRFCDKSLGAASYAGLLRQVWPQAQFISLYRHPMDVIASGIEACPYGLDGYGFEPYEPRFPGNRVAAIAQYWLDYTQAIAGAQRRFGPACLPVRYEDLVADPEGQARRVFDFLGVAAVPGITESMFSDAHQQAGQADHKIWKTTRVSADSVGRGWDIPASMIPAPMLAAVNAGATRLGYLPVTPDWGKGDRPDDLRV